MSVFERPLLAIVPARGGSKSIPRKPLQPVDGVPLLLRTLETVRNSDTAVRLVVSTEDREIAAFARLRGFEVVDRPAELADDDTPLADVVRHVVDALGWDGLVLVAQPTCPLLTPKTVQQLVEQFRRGYLDWAITGSPSERIVWRHGEPLLPRVNRQRLPKSLWVESGAVQLMTVDYARYPYGRAGVLPMPVVESLDIDTHADMAAARMALGRRTIEFRVVASTEKGSGHLWRCLQLSESLSHHNVRWSPLGLEVWARDIVERRGIEVGEHGMFPDTPDVVVVDALDAAEGVVPFWKAAGTKVVLFEHDGPATRFADLVVDEFADPKWTVLRPEFVALPPKRIEPHNKGSRVLVTFGGTDPSGLGARYASMLAYALDAEVRVVQGPGATPISPLGSRAQVVTDAVMSEQMRWADVVVTSQGRTVAEAVVCGTPVVSVAANERESRHARLPGVVYLGLHVQLADQTLIGTVQRLLDRPALRQEMVATSQGAIDGKGVRRIVHAIEGILEGL